VNVDLRNQLSCAVNINVSAERDVSTWLDWLSVSL